MRSNVARDRIRPTGAAADIRDQADSRWRPFRRRERITARPALVDIRFRKPWVLARLRTFGWYVRFTVPLPSSPETVCSGTPHGGGARHDD
jgi:hypothetical protein